jgi:hypothetical protein
MTWFLSILGAGAVGALVVIWALMRVGDRYDPPMGPIWGDDDPR